jgi:exosortase F-associated protein
MTKFKKVIFMLILICILFLIRMFEASLFYDPLLEFFKTDHTSKPLPSFVNLKLISNVAFRYLLNSLVSLAIIWVLFKDIGILKFSSLLYFILFIVLIIAFIILIFISKEGSHMDVFYVRRFLIQPIFLLILLPAFYFLQRT